ncbi:MAG TPA: hypothetical protein VFE47_04335 [Tepidisphaeraceae bacterium]|jgi:hypothetical protein|nr:hypothetical protein [Tepidisphaeraceae bacterium]
MSKTTKQDARGDCYSANGSKLLQMDKPEGWALVHAIISSNGVRMGHCWLDYGGEVFDYSNGMEMRSTVEVWYHHYRVEKTWRYTNFEYLALSDKHRGPFEPELLALR